LEQQFARTALALKSWVLQFIILFCLAFTCPSERAGAVDYGYSSDQGTCNANGVCSSTKDIPGYCAPPGDSKCSGMCGIFLFSISPQRINVARVEVIGHGYKVKLGWTGGGHTAPGIIEYTCAHFTEFSGVPAPSRAEMYQPAPVSNSKGMGQIGGKPDACVWTGTEGSLLAAQGAVPSVYTQVEKGDRTIAAAFSPSKPLSTYAFCYTYKNKTTAWHYYYVGGPKFYSGGPSLTSVHTDKSWCYMTGVSGGASINYSASLQTVPLQPFFGYQTSSGVNMSWNCLPFAQ
jgi:hypothetical protein